MSFVFSDAACPAACFAFSHPSIREARLALVAFAAAFEAVP
jgi:hypothetical protein